MEGGRDKEYNVMSNSFEESQEKKSREKVKRKGGI